MGLDIYGNIIYRNRYSKCEICSNYIQGYKCWYSDYINVMCWNGSESHKCKYFKSTISKQNNSHYVFKDFMDKKLFPNKVFGQGKYRFNARGGRI